MSQQANEIKSSLKIKNSYLRKQQHFWVMTKIIIRKTGICYSTKRVWLANGCRHMTLASYCYKKHQLANFRILAIFSFQPDCNEVNRDCKLKHGLVNIIMLKLFNINNKQLVPRKTNVVPSDEKARQNSIAVNILQLNSK